MVANNVSSTYCGHENSSTDEAISLPTGGVQIFTGFAMVAQLLVSLPASLLIGYLVLTRIELRKGVNFILLNCVSGECLIVLQWTVLGFYYNFIDNQAHMVCGCAALLNLVASTVIFNAYVVLAWNRYLAIHDTIRFEDVFSRRNTALFILGLWVFAIASAMPLLPYMRYEEAHHCGISLSGMPLALQVYFILTPFGGMTCTSSTVIYCNVKISRKLAAHRKQMARSNIRNEQLENGGFENIRKLMLASIILPLPFFVPFNVLRVFPAFSSQNPWLCRVLLTLDYAWPCTTPYLLVYCLKPFRVAVRQFFCGKKPAQVEASVVTASSSNVVAPSGQKARDRLSHGQNRVR